VEEKPSRLARLAALQRQVHPVFRAYLLSVQVHRGGKYDPVGPKEKREEFKREEFKRT